MLKLVEKDADGVHVHERDLMQVRYMCACTDARQAGFGVAHAMQGSLTLVMQARYVRACTAARQAWFGVAHTLVIRALYAA